MQMPITNAASSAAPTAAAGTASAKGAENGNGFGQTFVQTITGTESGTATSQTAADANIAAAVPMNALASLLGENLSSADLLAAIEALIQKLNDTDTEQLVQTASESELSDTLVQLDNLLSMLAGMQPLQPVQNVLSTQELASGGDQTGATATDRSEDRIAQLDDLYNMLAGLQNMLPVQNELAVQEQTIGGNRTFATVGDGSDDRLPQLDDLLNMLAGLQNMLPVQNELAVQEQTIGGNRTVATVGDGSDDRLAQLDDLLNMLAGLQNILPIQKKLDAQEQAIGGDRTVATVGDGSDNRLAQLDILLKMLASLQINQTSVIDGNGSEDNMLLKKIATFSNFQADASAVRDAKALGTSSTPLAEATVNLDVIEFLKSSFQDALADLRAIVQKQKGTDYGREHNADISRQLAALEQLLSGTKSEATAVVKAAKTQSQTLTQSGETDTAIRTMQSVPASNNHLQRMAHQFLHVGLLKASAKPEQEPAAASMPQPVELGSINLAALASNQDLQRQQLAASKQVISQPVQVQQFASTIQGMIVGQFNVKAAGGLSNAQLTLYPEHLGQVNVNITMHNGTLTAQFMTDTVVAKDLLDNQMAQLRSALQAHGLQVEKLEVSQLPAQSSLHFQERQGQGRREQNPSKQNGSRDESDFGIDFNADLEEVSAQQTVDRDLGLGRGIHTTA